MNDAVVFEGSAVFVRSAAAARLATALRWFLDGERARRVMPARDDLELLAGLERVAAASTAVWGNGAVVEGQEEPMIVRDECSTTEAGNLLNLKPRRVRQLCEPGGPLRSRMPNGRILVETQSVLVLLAEREMSR